jgi:hypothetical protein
VADAGNLAAQLLDQVAQGAASMLDVYPWEPGRAWVNFDALENLADAMALIRSAPTSENATHGIR